MSLVPQVGIGVIILKNNKVLLGKRKNTHGNGHWGFAGGHLEFLESPEDCAVRETTEEAGIKISNPRVVAIQTIFLKTKINTILLFMFWQTIVKASQVYKRQISVMNGNGSNGKVCRARFFCQ